MKKTLILSVSTILLLSSCGSYAGVGAYTGGTFGSIIGSAIGGIAGGPRGSDIGTLIGIAGGAVVGAAVGAAADNAEQQRYEAYKYERQQSRAARSQYDRSQYDRVQPEEKMYDETNSGDDRLYGFDEDFNSTATPAPSASSPSLEIRKPRLVDMNRDGVLTRGETARMVFEVFNTSSEPVYRVLPLVAEITNNRHIRISENVLVESIAPGKGIRYTATIKADDRLKDGEAVIRIAVKQGGHEITSQTREFRIQTSKR